MRYLFYSLCFLLFPSWIIAQHAGQGKSTLLLPGTAATTGFAPDRLKRIDHFLQQYVNDKQMNGAVMLVARNGQLVYHKSTGYADMENKIPMKNDHIFRIASMTKPIISVAVMMLYEEGKFLLDDAVSKFIPEFKNPVVLEKFNAGDTTFTTVPAKSEITIRHLLTHTSGIGYAQIGSAEANAIYYKHKINGGIGTPFSTLKQVIPRLAKLPLFNHPGEAYLYGLNTDVLGYLVEAVSGMPLDKFLQTRIFTPLGMNDTYFYLPKEKQNRLVKLYMQDNKGVLRLQDSIISLNGTFHRDFPKTNGGTYFSGGAGLSSTAYDYAIFCQMLVNGGEYNGARLLSPHTIEMMTRNQVGELQMWNNPNTEYRFGLGFGIYTEKSELTHPVAAGSFDWAGMFASHFWIDPENKLVVVLMRNVWPTVHWDLGQRVKPLVYQAMIK